ncbi:MAG: metallophosphoesterase [Phascolarctobacterium sp.]|nr:metallophosphoesterase [Phascolarctobacterium sp.]
MKIGVTGDTHGSEQALRRIIQLAPPVEIWLHTGDYSQDANFLADISGLPVIKVCGNCDPVEMRANPDEIFSIEGFRIWLTHGNRYLHYDDVEELAARAAKLEVDIVVFGHIHLPVAKWYGDILLLNPGSPARPRSEAGPSFAVLNLIAGQRANAEFIELTEVL